MFTDADDDVTLRNTPEGRSVPDLTDEKCVQTIPKSTYGSEINSVEHCSNQLSDLNLTSTPVRRNNHGGPSEFTTSPDFPSPPVSSRTPVYRSPSYTTSSDSMSSLDPWNKVLFNISKDITQQMVKDMKFLVSGRSEGMDGACVVIPDSKLEMIEGGADMLKVLNNTIKEKDRLLTFLGDIFAQMDERVMESVVKKIQQEWRDTTNSLEESEGFMKKIISSQLPRELSLYYKKLTDVKGVGRTANGQVVFVKTEKDTKQIIKIERILWETVLSKKEEIKKCYTSVLEGGDDRLIKIMGDCFVSVARFKQEILVHLRVYYGEEAHPKPSKVGLALTYEKWNKFLDYLKEAAAVNGNVQD